MTRSKLAVPVKIGSVLDQVEVGFEYALLCMFGSSIQGRSQVAMLLPISMQVWQDLDFSGADQLMQWLLSHVC